MKKLMLLFIITGIGLSQIYAQGEPKSGIKASSYISNYLLKDLENCQSIMKTGISFGGFMIIGITDLWAIQPELMIQYKKSKIENQSEKATSEYKCWAVEMPVYAVIQKKLGTGRGYIGIGPYVGVGFYSELSGTNLYDNEMMNRLDFGAAGMIGYELKFGLQINAGYQIGLINMLVLNNDLARMRTQAINLGLAYKF